MPRGWSRAGRCCSLSGVCTAMVRAQGRQTLCEQGRMMGSLKSEPHTGHFSSSSMAAAVCTGMDRGAPSPLLPVPSSFSFSTRRARTARQGRAEGPAARGRRPVWPGGALWGRLYGGGRRREEPLAANEGPRSSRLGRAKTAWEGALRAEGASLGACGGAVWGGGAFPQRHGGFLSTPRGWVANGSSGAEGSPLGRKNSAGSPPFPSGLLGLFS